jgi:hypothetical protein
LSPSASKLGRQPCWVAFLLICVSWGEVLKLEACCKAGLSSNPGSAPQGGVFHWADKRWRNGERPQPMTMDKCFVWMWMWLNECMNVIKNMKNKQKERHPATKP